MNRTIPVATIAVLMASTGWAETERQMEKHEHGHGELHMVFEKKTLQMQLHSPMVNVVGFEHAPQNEAEEEAVHEMLEKLHNLDNIVRFDKKSRCEIAEISFELPEGFDDHGDHDHDEHAHEEHGDHDHDEHAHEEHGDHDHDEHAHEEHGDHDEHDEDEHHHEHSEIRVTWEFECKQQPRTFDVYVLNTFSGFHELDVEALTPNGAVAVEVDTKSAEVSLP